MKSGSFYSPDKREDDPVRCGATISQIKTNEMAFR